MTITLIGYARCSTDKQDLAAQKAVLAELGVSPDRIYTDHGLTGTNRSRPGLDQALAAMRTGDTLVVPKLDRLARSVPDARSIADALVARGIKLALGASVYNSGDALALDYRKPKLWNGRGEAVYQTLVGSHQKVVALDRLSDDPKVVLVDLEGLTGSSILPILKPARDAARHV